MSRHSGRFVTLVAALFTISTAMADRSVNPSPMLDLVDAFNLTALDLHDLDLAALFPDGLPTQEPPVYPGHPNELYKVLPPVVNQLPVQTPLIPTLRVTTEKSYTTKTAENQTPGSSSTTEKPNVDGSTNQLSYESDVTVLETEGLDYETTRNEARETVFDELRTPTVKESMPPTTMQEPTTPTQYEGKSTTQYETNLPTLYDTQPPIEYETNPPPVRYDTNGPMSYETNSPPRHEPSPHSLSTLLQTSSVFKQQTTEALQAYPTTTALFVRITDPREPTAYTPKDSYGTPLEYDVTHISAIPTKTQTRATPHPTRQTKKVSSKQTKPIPSKLASSRRPQFGEKFGHKEIRVKGPSDTPQRKGHVPSGHSKLTYDDINRRRNTKRQISKQPTVKWVKIPSTRPPSTTPSKNYINEYKPIKIMHQRHPYRIRNQPTPLARTTSKDVVTMKEASFAKEVIAPYNSHSNPKLQTTTPSYDVNTGRSPTTLHSKPSFEIHTEEHQPMNPEPMSHLYEEKPAVDYLESQPAAATRITEDQTTREVISTHRPAQTTTIIEEEYLRPTSKRPHPNGSADKKRVPLRRRPDGSHRSLAPTTTEPNYYRPSTVKAVVHLSSTKEPTRYRPQKLKQAVNLPAVAGGSANKNYATSYVISNNAFRDSRHLAGQTFHNIKGALHNSQFHI